MTATGPEPGGQQEWRPFPDPTLLTTQQLLRELASLRELFDARLGGMDRATVLLSETVNRTPTVIQTEISHLRELLGQRMDAMQNLLDERYTTQTKALDAAFANQQIALAAVDASTERRFGDIAAQQAEAAGRIATFITRREYDTASQAQLGILQEIRERLGTLASQVVPRAETDAWREALTDKLNASAGRNAEEIRALTTRIDRGEGSASGQQLVTGSPFDAAALQQAADANRSAASARIIATVIAGVSALVAVITVIALILKK